jgi:hypothetical protein
VNRPLAPSVVYCFKQTSATARFFGESGVILWQETTALAAMADRRDGRILWTYKDSPLPRRGCFNPPIVVEKTVVLQLPWEEKLYEPSVPFLAALSGEDGRLLWRVPIKGQTGRVTLHAHQGRLFGWGSRIGIVEVDLHDGKLIKRSRPEEPVASRCSEGRFLRWLETPERCSEAYDATTGRKIWRAKHECVFNLPGRGIWEHSRYVVVVGCAALSGAHPKTRDGYGFPFEPVDPSQGDRVQVFGLEDGRLLADVRLPWHVPGRPLMEDGRIRLIGRDTDKAWFPVIDLELGTGKVQVGERVPVGENHGDGSILGSDDGALVMTSDDFGVYAADPASAKGRRWSLDIEHHCDNVVVDSQGLLACARYGGIVYQAEFAASPPEPRRVRVQARKT